ncbi:MAG TPA: TlpA disulfide reductase family protein [Pirellulales bacterium]|nr:TlpA disulfide reductase family protein [Pirellulales bacterium]
MLNWLTTLAAIASLLWTAGLGATETALKPGTQLLYRGGVAELQAGRSPGEPSKTFDLTLWVAEANESGTKFYWLVDERGQGHWPWPERFGEWSLDAEGQAAGVPGPALLYEYGGGRSVIPLVTPLVIVPAPPAVDVAWERDDLTFRIDGEKKISGRETWQVQTNDKFGLKRTLWLDRSSPLVVGCDERVFMNQGTEYRLQLRLTAAGPLAADEWAAAQSSFAAMLALRGKLNRPPRTEEETWTHEQRQALAEHLPSAEKSASTGPLSKIVRAAARDLHLQAGRADAVAELSAKFEGKEVGKFAAAGLGPDTLTNEDLKGNVTVLHFWDYRHEPLEEPYGQVGYLEFLYSRRKAEGAKVYGIAVDGRLNDEATRGTVAAGVRKLKGFMNLSYPIVLDGGSLIKQFGDPRLAGATLPLVVVVGPNGRIVHYHVGHYEVDRQAGLKQLDDVVEQALKDEKRD